MSMLLLLGVLVPAIGGGAAMLWSIMDGSSSGVRVERLATTTSIMPDAGMQAIEAVPEPVQEPDASVVDMSVDASTQPVDAGLPAEKPRAVSDTEKKKPKKSPANTVAQKPKAPEPAPAPEPKAKKKPMSTFARSLLAGPNGPGAQLPAPSTRKADDEPPPSADMPEELSQAQILNVIKQYKKALQRCHERQLKREPLKESRLTLRFRIRASGRTSSVSIGREYDGTILKGCLDSLVRRWRFPRFRGEPIDIEYPLIFTMQY